MKNKKVVHTGNIEITKENQAEWKEKAKTITHVTGNVYVSGSATFPLLAEVGGYVDVYGSATFPERKPTNNVTEAFERKGYIFADGILTKLVSKRKQGNVTVYKTKEIGSSKIVYVVKKANLYSHGETVKQAIADLRYKLADRDTTKYAKWTMDTITTADQMIQAYRAITGACEAGTKQWCQGRKLPARISVKVAIRITKGQYGAEKFSGFFRGGK